MESNRGEAYRCIELTKLYIKKKDLDNAWKFAVKANKLFPSSETKHLMKKLKSSLKGSKRQSTKQNQSENDDSGASYNGDNSSSSSSNDCSTQQPRKKSKINCKSSTVYSFKMFKEINKDESYKCLEKAKHYLKNKQYESANKFLLKSKKLFPVPEADELLKKLQEIQELSKPKYTKEQENIVIKVKNSENFYKMLDIKTTATVPEIKKAYKKLALLLHPDKNSAPNSGEVFIIVSNAVDTLCDHTKRKIYDQSLRKPSTSTSNHCSYSTFRQHNFSTSFNTNRSSPYRYYHYDSSDYDDDFYTENDYYSSFDYFDSYDYEY